MHCFLCIFNSHSSDEVCTLLLSSFLTRHSPSCSWDGSHKTSQRFKTLSFEFPMAKFWPTMI